MSVQWTSRRNELARRHDFELIREIGDVSEGQVWLARHRPLNRKVVLRFEPAPTERDRATPVLEHDHIVRVFSEIIDPTANLRVLCSQYVPGTTLARLLDATSQLKTERLSGCDLLDIVDRLSREMPLLDGAMAEERLRFSRFSYDEALAELGAQLAEALAYAHEHGAPHCGVKPENILITPLGRAYLMDFDVPARPRNADFEKDVTDLSLVLAKAWRPSRKSKSRTDWRFEQVLTRHGNGRPPRDASALAGCLRGFLEWREISKQFPPAGFLMRFSGRFPLLAILTVRQIPHLLATVFTTTYCMMRKGMPLNEGQRAVMAGFLRRYNSISYPLGICLVTLIAWSVMRAWRSRKTPCLATGELEASKWRARALRLPWLFAVVNSFTWLSSIAVFTIAAYSLTGKFNPAGFAHFSVAVVMGWLIATAYSTLFALFVVVRVVFPSFLPLRVGMRKVASRDLAKIMPLMRWLPLPLGLVPLVAAFLVMQIGPGDLNPDQFHWFRTLLALLIGGGTLGFLFTMAAMRNLTQILTALTTRTTSSAINLT